MDELLLDEARLLRDARLGDRRAFGGLVDLHGPQMYRFALRMLGDDHDARDAVQEAFISAWKDLEHYEGRSTFSTWLLRLTHRRAVDLQRRRTPTPVDDEGIATLLPPQQGDPLQRVLEDELVEALQSALLELPRSQRATWLLREVEQMSYDEIAEALATTPDSVRGLLHRARSALSERMSPWR
ncbi:RNA polymerase sigma factor [Aeromicrobium sp. CF4.19]|uniref:RNA polymerase sigma factor n=1 Tax=Aeromicrobium sp. CF4.19 TaxID=3373082 RepID=UPI003EE74A12